jgi:hypothetical protein
MYETGVIVTSVISGIIFLLFLILNFIHISKQLINEEEINLLIPDFMRFDHDSPEDAFLNTLCAILGVIGTVMVVTFLWPLALMVLIWYGIIYTLRKLVRFKKKVNKALSGKDKPDHTHEWERQ